MSLAEIEKAISEKGVLKIKYHGGSQPGSIREIVPRSIKGDKVRAFCLSSEADKTFKIDKIEILGDDTPVQEYIPKQDDNYDGIGDLLKAKGEYLESLGWHILTNSSTEQLDGKDILAPADVPLEQQNETLGLYTLFKNGKPRKTPNIELSFTLLTWEAVATENGEIKMGNLRKMVKPWRVWGKGDDGRSYGTLSKAAIRFLLLAENIKP
jgi:hypothetical protein